MKKQTKIILGSFLMVLLSEGNTASSERRPIDPAQLEISVQKLRDQQRQERGKIKEMLDENHSFERQYPNWDQMIEEFQGEGPGEFFLPHNFQKFLDTLRPHQHLAPNQSKWMETPTEHIFILQLAAAKDTPLEIKVNKSEIMINATVEEKTQRQDEDGNRFSAYSQRSFQQRFPVPADGDGERAVVENKKGEIWIRIPKKNR